MPQLGWTRPVFVEADIQCADVHRSNGWFLCRHCSCPGSSACYLKGRIKNLFMKFSSHHMKKEGCNCSEWLVGTDGTTAFSSTSMSDD
jgi:hypothetical protein